VFNPDSSLGENWGKKPFVVSLSNHERPFDRLRASEFQSSSRRVNSVQIKHGESRKNENPGDRCAILFTVNDRICALPVVEVELVQLVKQGAPADAQFGCRA
jgi:hypothetical protein